MKEHIAETLNACFLRASRDPEGARPRATKAERVVHFGWGLA